MLRNAMLRAKNVES